MSTIIPFYNQARFLGRAVESILSQTLTDIECIVIDDGSPEDPMPILARFLNDPRLKVHRQTNSGVALARNAAIAVSKGTHTHFMDADDWIAPTMYEKVTAALETDSAIGMAYCDLYRVREDESPADDYRISNSRAILSGDILPSLLAGGYFPPVCAIVRSSVLRKVGNFDSSLGGCCDWDLWMRIAASDNAAIFNSDRLAFYRLHGSSMSKDLSHMNSTAEATLAKNMSAYPFRMACSIQSLIKTSEDVFSAKEWLAKKNAELETTIVEAQKYTKDLLTGKEWLAQQYESLTAHVHALEVVASEAAELRIENTKLRESIANIENPKPPIV